MVGGTVTNTPIEELADKLLKPVIRKFWKHRSVFIFYGQHFGSWACWYAVNK